MLPLSVPTPVVAVNVPEYSKVKGKLGPVLGMHPLIWSVTVPTALLPEYVVLNATPRSCS